MIKTFIRTSERTIEISIPQSWEECSFAIGKRLVCEAQDQVSAISIITGLDFGLLTRSMQVPDVLALLQCVSWCLESPIGLRFARPETVEINGKTLTLNDDLGEMTYAFHIDTDAITNLIDIEKPDTILDAYEAITAGYLQELYDGEYDNKRAKEFRQYIPALSFGTVAGIANFFLRKKAGYMIGGAIIRRGNL